VSPWQPLFFVIFVSNELHPALIFSGMSFEKNLNRLDAIVGQLESESLALDDSLRLFEEGIELLRQASEELKDTETRVKELVERADGALELRDFGT
jgi:exodeoxyribonuclease VII small subunit